MTSNTMPSLHSPKPLSRRGIAAVYSILMLVALCGLVSMGVDLGRVQVAKTELRAAADAAARAGVAGLAVSVTQAKSDATTVAAANLCDGSAVVLDQTLDIEFGTWNDAARTFTVLSGAAQNNANSMRITARRVAARSTAIPLVFARVLGRNTCDINAVAVAKATFGPGWGFTGLSSITMKNNTWVVSYNSSVDTSPGLGTVYGNALLGSNGFIAVGTNDHLWGNVQLGPSGSVDPALQVTGSTYQYTTALQPPAMPSWSPGANPGGISQNYTVNSTTTLPGGNYWFTSLDVDHDLTFSGPATIYVNGNVTIDSDLKAYGNIPSNLKIYQLGANRTFGDSKANNVNITADIQAPGSDFTMNNNLTFMGVAIFETITTRNDAIFFVDEAAGMGAVARQIVLVK
jgi:Flp pilus assembly protein TadG